MFRERVSGASSLVCTGLKAEIRAGRPVATQEAATQTQGPDLVKLKEELRKEVKREFQKKVSLLTAVSKSDLND